MKILDLTGPMYDGMWCMGEPYPPVRIEEIPPPEWIEYVTYSQRMSLGVQSGTYLETSAHMFADGPKLHEIPVDRLFFEAVIIQLPEKTPEEQIEAQEIERFAPKIREGDAIFVATGWDTRWREPDFLLGSPNFSRGAMDWILDHKPFLLGSDLPRWDSWKNPQLFFERFFRQGTLLLAPLVNLRALKQERVRIAALPVKLENTVAAPCRVVAMLSDED